RSAAFGLGLAPGAVLDVIDQEVLFGLLAAARVIVDAVALGIVRGAVVDVGGQIPLGFGVHPGALVVVEKPGAAGAAPEELLLAAHVHQLTPAPGLARPRNNLQRVALKFPGGDVVEER